MTHSVLSTCAGLLLLLPLSLHAGFIKEWQLAETASAPVLVTGRILGVHRNERVPEDQLGWKAETWSMTADVEVLRSFTASGTPLAAQRIQVHFLAYGPSVTRFINGYPPPLPDIRSGEVRILPLRENTNPASERWQLMADSGADLIIPGRADAEHEPAPPPQSARSFLILEFANTLSRGTPGEVAALSSYVYGVLWQYATESGNPREVRVLAVVLADRRIASDNVRYCDYALGEFYRITKERFDIAAASIPERDAAISRALARIKAH